MASSAMLRQMLKLEIKLSSENHIIQFAVLNVLTKYFFTAVASNIQQNQSIKLFFSYKPQHSAHQKYKFQTDPHSRKLCQYLSF